MKGTGAFIIGSHPLTIPSPLGNTMQKTKEVHFGVTDGLPALQPLPPPLTATHPLSGPIILKRSPASAASPARGPVAPAALRPSQSQTGREGKSLPSHPCCLGFPLAAAVSAL